MFLSLSTACQHPCSPSANHPLLVPQAPTPRVPCTFLLHPFLRDVSDQSEIRKDMGSQLLLKVDNALTTSIYKTLGPVCSVDCDLSSFDNIQKHSYELHQMRSSHPHSTIRIQKSSLCEHAHHFHRTFLHARLVNAHSTLYFHAYRHKNQKRTRGRIRIHARARAHTHTHRQLHALTHTNTHAHTHEHAHTHIRTHAQTLII